MREGNNDHPQKKNYLSPISFFNQSDSSFQKKNLLTSQNKNMFKKLKKWLEKKQDHRQL